MSRRPIIPVTIAGVVTARPCECCGHHEIGLVTDTGDFIPLRPGMRVRIIDSGDPDGTDPSDPA